ncbi:serine/threonine protein kinase [Mucilaginibacter sp. BJC16-A38]|uniref:serine/threonine protein kinase n=1 Tax=Mucilaginibacter phenanthrenivorans TaxID=1234842 RepID=UPI0021589899|nr:serine/threonine-protein kinase [Mucilaginibacter phenanthrenivorans]MCR8558114.1 serine/threonine protein kinase [Mucilaginibacter phenanthrenivorans]
MSKIFTITEGLENMGALRTGGQGSVYKGRRMGPIFSAVKLLPTPIHNESMDDHNYRNFINEVEKLKKVNEIPNPNVVKILNSGITESGSLPFIEMEFIEGPDLGELLKPPHEVMFTIKEVIKLADQLASALSHCHKVGVKHGDIKSNNVKFNIHSGNYVLLDFGLSAMSDEQRRSSMRHAGAIEFMAPEQNEGQLLFQTDIYSYGVIVYELLAGRVPFLLQDNGETARNNVMLSHMESAVPDVLELRKQNLPNEWPVKQQEREMQVPAWLLSIVSKCLEKRPEDRFKDGTALQEILGAYIGTENRDGAKKAIAALRSENEDLHSRILAYQKQVTQPSTIAVPRKLMVALILVFLGAIAFGIFKTPLKSSLMPAKPDTVFIQPNLAAIKRKAIVFVKDSLRRDSIRSAKKRLLLEKKAKRKKFLGLF